MDPDIENLLIDILNESDDEEIFDGFNEGLDLGIIGAVDLDAANGNIIAELFQEENDPPVIDSHWFNVVVPQFNDNQFFSHFRMRPEIYIELENIVMPHVGVDDDVPARKKILLTLWIIATPDSFRSVADRFGLHRSRSHEVFVEIVNILKNLMPQFVQWPNAQQRDEAVTVFHVRSGGFPGVIGAIDGCHVAIKQPPGNANDYYNRKGFHSIVLQGTCDHTGKFIDCLIGRPGRAHDASIFRSSILFRQLTNAQNRLLPPDQHLLADSAYPLLGNVMTPFKDNGHLTAQQIGYNIKLASIRSVIERAFGLLKCKWRRLVYLDVKSVDMANNIVAAACMLHNFLIIHGAANVRDVNLHHVENVPNEDDDNDGDNGNVNLTGQEKRQRIMNFL